MMAHWSVIDEPESPAAPEPATAEPVAAERSPVERIAEILEALFLKEPGLTRELLEELGRADTATLAKLFGVSAPPSAEQPPVELLSAKPGPTWSSPVSESPSRPDEEPRWDSNGYRLNPPPRNVFPRHEQPRGTHWSR
jgi:hypothetical protein